MAASNRIARGQSLLIPEIEITGLSFGPYAVARADGEVLMVPNAAPGDRLEVSIRAHRHDYALARIERIIAPGASRRSAPCPYLPQCGGCDWQHLDYPAQLREKAALAAAGLARAMNVDLDPQKLVEPAPQEFGYRSRIRLKAGRAGALGFFELGSNRLVEIDRCMVAAPAIRVPNQVACALGANLAEIEVVCSGDRQVLCAYLKKPPAPAEIKRVSAVMENDRSIQGMVLSAGLTRQVIGDPAIRIEIEEGLELIADADAFIQVNQAQNRNLVASVMEMAGIEPGAGVLDLFCGAGNLSIPAARRGAEVTGVDSDPRAIAAAQKNASRLNLAGAKFIAMKAADTAQFLIRAGYRAQTVMLDPPRTGAADIMQAIVRMRPRTAIYISCDMATLARDVRILTAAGYRAGRIRAFDFFPNTHHLEIVAQLVLT